ncbi:D-arabinono-1,4-lactone oxidase-domain-containing protein, partial [Dactylonectria macrodidyma]
LKNFGGRPHWAKNVRIYRPEIEAFYGKDLESFRAVRNDVDPQGMFVGPWHRDRIMADGVGLGLEEVELRREKSRKQGVTTYGAI